MEITKEELWRRLERFGIPERVSVTDIYAIANSLGYGVIDESAGGVARQATARSPDGTSVDLTVTVRWG